MNNAYVMTVNFESRKNTQATAITFGVALFLLALMFLLKWTVPVVEHPPAEQGILVDLNLPEEEPEPTVRATGGGGGGNPVQAAGPAGVAEPSPPQPGTDDDAKDVEEDPNEKETPPILKPDNPKPTATKINENKSPVKAEPKPDPKPPAPPTPKAVLGRTTTGSGKGGGAADDYDRSGGKGTGTGVGNGSGYGGGSGSGSGGGNGSGTGRGNGPRVSSGDRSVVGSYSFTADLEKATVYAFVKVSPSGAGEFVGIAKGSTATSAAYKNEIVRYLRTMRFNKSDHESMVTVEFKFRVEG
ncbi:MAG: hypothetical protein EOO09_13110 [Chitinophagaceae bacterium]|nr:MAG: hypothetical protein EOO09_13110 [Chitinophagaceae bacterium]